MPQSRLMVPVTDRDHIAGRLNAPVILVEYGDFECPHCGRAYDVIEAARRYLGDELCLVYRHFPLVEIHPHAQLAAESAEAASAQGRFWEMHALLFRHQQALAPENLLVYARMAGCEVPQVAADLASGKWTRRVMDDRRGGAASGVFGTPTFFINELRYDGPWADFPTFIGVLSHTAQAAHAVTPH
jgi:protein-disulfide isomerase